MQYIPLNLIVNELSQLSSACLNGYEFIFYQLCGIYNDS